MVRVTCGRRDPSRTKNGDFLCKIGGKSQLGWILGLYRVIMDINAYMLIFISKLTEITNIPEKIDLRNFSGNSGYFGPEPSRRM